MINCAIGQVVEEKISQQSVFNFEKKKKIINCFGAMFPVKAKQSFQRHVDRKRMETFFVHGVREHMKRIRLN